MTKLFEISVEHNKHTKKNLATGTSFQEANDTILTVDAFRASSFSLKDAVVFKFN